MATVDSVTSEEKKKLTKALKKLGDLLSIYPEEYLDEVEKESERRWETIKETHRKLRNIFDTKNISDKMEFYDDQTRNLSAGMKYIYMRNNIQISVEKRTYYTHFLTLMTWIDPRAVEKYLSSLLPLMVNEEIGLFTYMKYENPSVVSNKLVRASTKDLNTVIGKATHIVGAVGATAVADKRVIPKLIDHNYATMLAPTARMIVENTRAYYMYSSHTGSRLGLYGQLGAGKTTISFYSIYSALRFLGFNEEEAINSASAMIINDPYILINIFSEISESNITENPIYVPALVADDIASMVSKYWFTEVRELRTAVMYLVRALKIAREYIGLFVFPSDVKGSIPGAIRESLDVDIRSETFNYRGRKASVWMKERRITTITQQTYKTTKMRKEPVLEELTGTVSPPMYMPPTVYRTLTQHKVRARAMWLRRAKAAMTQLISEAKEFAEIKKNAATTKEELKEIAKLWESIAEEEELKEIAKALEETE